LKEPSCRQAGIPANGDNAGGARQLRAQAGGIFAFSRRDISTHSLLPALLASIAGTFYLPAQLLFQCPELRMNLVIALDRLQMARRFVRDGQECMIKQREIVALLEEKGCDADEAILLLEYLEDMQAKYEAHRDQVELQVLGLVKPEGNDD
jgi:hypothetical protein